METEERIADFFEERAIVYDKGSPDYKNKQKRNVELSTFAAALGKGFTCTIHVSTS